MTAPLPRAHPHLVLASVLTAQLMVVLDATVVNIALPDIQGSLHISAANLSWIPNAYTLTLGGLLLLGARVGDLLGHRPTFLAGIALFTLTSLLGGAAQSSGELLVARALQGVGAALASPTGLAILTTMFSEGRERTRAIGYYTAVSIGGGALGLIAGGVLTEYASWRWVLLVNVPIGAVLLVLAARSIVATARRQGHFDLPGALTSTAGMTAVTFGFVHAAQHGWANAITVGSFVVGVALLVLFVAVELRAEQPITPLRLFADRNRSASYVVRLLLIAGIQGMFFFLTQLLQDVLGYDPLRTGLAFLPTTLMVFAASQLASRLLLERLGPRVLTALGLTCSTTAMAWLTQLDVQSSYASILVPLLLLGTGNGLAFVPLTATALSGVQPRDAGAAAGLVNAVQQVGGSVGLAVLVTMSGSAARSYARGEHPGLGPAQVAQEAFVHGADRAFLTAALMLLAGWIIAVAVIRPAVRPSAVTGLDEAVNPEVITT